MSLLRKKTKVSSYSNIRILLLKQMKTYALKTEAIENIQNMKFFLMKYVYYNRCLLQKKDYLSYKPY
jgi:hypothetical protein